MSWQFVISLGKDQVRFDFHFECNDLLC